MTHWLVAKNFSKSSSSSPKIRNIQLIINENYLSSKPRLAYTNLFIGLTTILSFVYYFYDRKKIL
ncbi:MAG: hypothetical protein VXZ27_10760, partial [SAR324 cluster bacterium]|nr:hypothetical protein [SAR324 cluster bacterium]